MINVIFGKSVEAVEKHKEVQLVIKWNAKEKRKSARKLIAQPNFHSISIFDENFVAIQMTPLKIKLDRPTYIGFTILEFSKHVMYEMFYDYLKPKFRDKLKLVYVDIDCLLFKLEDLDFKSMIREDIPSRFDTSGFDPEKLEKFNFPVCNKKKLSMFKNECNGFCLTHFICYRCKCYAFSIENRDFIEIRARLKGVDKSVVRKYNLPFINRL